MSDNSQLAGNLEYALEYIKRGWKIFPVFYVLSSGQCSCRKAGCKRVGKHPTTKNGVQDASSDEAAIRAWWTESPWANIGLATGHGGLIVIDVDEGMDEKTGAPKVGPASLKALVEANAMLPATLAGKTGGGGSHYYFLSTQEIQNDQGKKLGKDIDIRGYGGYVILPPSNHKSGNKYEWSTPIDHKIEDMPTWLEKLCMTRREVDMMAHVDEAQNELVKKTLKQDKFNASQLVRLLDFIPPDCDRDTWWQVGAALKKELGDRRGWDVWVEWSEKAPEKYDAKTAFVQWGSFDPNRKGADGKVITGGTIYHYAKTMGGFRGFDVEAADSNEFHDKWIYAYKIKSFIETARLLEWDHDQFDARFAPIFERGKAPGHVLRNADFKRVDGVTYWPNQPLYVTESEQTKLNFWRESNVTPALGDVTPFLDHVTYLFPKDKGDEGDILLDYLAYQVRHPGEKVHWAVLLEGDQGNGKSYFATVMKLIL